LIGAGDANQESQAKPVECPTPAQRQSQAGTSEVEIIEGEGEVNSNTSHTVGNSFVKNGSQTSKLARGGFSILDEISESIVVGKALGFRMKGCKKDLRAIIKGVGDNDIFK